MLSVGRGLLAREDLAMASGGPYESRVLGLKLAMEKAGLEAVFVQGSSSDLQYLFGVPRAFHHPTDHDRYGDVLSGAWIPLQGDPVFTAPRMDAAEDLRRSLSPSRWTDRIRVIGDGILGPLEDPVKVVEEIVAELSPFSTLGITGRVRASGVLALQHAFPSLRIRDASDLLQKLRSVKDEGELLRMQRAARLTERAFSAVLSQLRVGMTAREIALEVDGLFARFGADGPSFHTGIRITGPHLRLRPGEPERSGDTPVQPGVAIAFDMGCVLEGYSSDFGRTVFWGEPSPAMVRFYETITKSQTAAVERLAAGQTTAAELNVVARGVIEAERLGQYFVHRLGHGIGIDLHESPFLFPGDDTILEEGMCFTIEPSLRTPEAAVRVEDVFTVTPEGGKSLHQFSRELLVVG
jgi:Xaa-Pro aminopeptidase